MNTYEVTFETIRSSRGFGAGTATDADTKTVQAETVILDGPQATFTTGGETVAHFPSVVSVVRLKIA